MEQGKKVDENKVKMMVAISDSSASSKQASHLHSTNNTQLQSMLTMCMNKL